MGTNGRPKFIVERGLENRIEHAVNGANTVEDLQRYLSHPEPHPDYDLVSVQLVSGSFLLVWQLREVLRCQCNCGPNQ